MNNTASIAIFMLVAFSLAIILIMKKDTIQPSFRRPLAILALVMVSFSFVLLIYSLLHYQP